VRPSWQGSKRYNSKDKARVGHAGEFIATVLPKAGLKMRSNLQVDVTFFPNWDQPAIVTKKFGKRGEKLNGPQIEGNAGGAYIAALTVVKE